MGRRKFLALFAAAMGALALPLTPPARQRFHTGGRVTNPQIYLVGESGPEWFIPLKPGRIIPNA